MASKVRLDWKGDDVHKRMLRAAANGIDRTLAPCVNDAKGLVRVKTATLQGSIRFEPAEIHGTRISGLWGSFDVNYALWQEIGTHRMSAKPYLRPAADRNYGQLAANIRREFA